MYLIEVTPHQYQQANIDNLRETSYPKMFFINSTTRPIHINTAPRKPAETIGFGPPCNTPTTTTVVHASPVEQHLQRQFQPSITGSQRISDNMTSDTHYW